MVVLFQLQEKVRTLCMERSIKNVFVVKILIQLLLNLTVRCKPESRLLINLSKQLQEEIGVLPDMVFINPDSLNVFFNSFSGCINFFILHFYFRKQKT
jgi:hypothetical protein